MSWPFQNAAIGAGVLGSGASGEDEDSALDAPLSPKPSWHLTLPLAALLVLSVSAIGTGRFARDASSRNLSDSDLRQSLLNFRYCSTGRPLSRVVPQVFAGSSIGQPVDASVMERTANRARIAARYVAGSTPSQMVWDLDLRTGTLTPEDSGAAEALQLLRVECSAGR